MKPLFTTASILVLATTITPDGLPGSDVNLTSSNEIGYILGVVFNILGALALLIVTVSGLRYVTSTGDPQRTAQAKNGIIYALVGLAVAITARAIVAFVVGKL